MSVNRYFAGAMDKIKLVLDKKESEHLNTLSHHFGFKKIFDSPGEQDIKNDKKDAGGDSPIQK